MDTLTNDRLPVTPHDAYDEAPVGIGVDGQEPQIRSEFHLVHTYCPTSGRNDVLRWAQPSRRITDDTRPQKILSIAVGEVPYGRRSAVPSALHPVLHMTGVMPEPTPNLSGTRQAFLAEAAATGPSSGMGLGDGERSHREMARAAPTFPQESVGTH